MILVKHILEPARKRLAVLSLEASICDVAQSLANQDTHTPLVVVCDSDGIAVGVIAPIHIVHILASAGVDALSFNAGAIMNSRTLPCAPILDDDGRPQGVLFARDVAIALIDEVNYDEKLLRDYVMGVGYQ